MTAQEKIEQFLRQNAEREYCDDCLSDMLNVRPRQQVQQKTAHLARENRFWRQSGFCSKCRRTRIVIRLRTAFVG
jgi:hypothetical protein